jgi:hypothetical protein
MEIIILFAIIGIIGNIINNAAKKVQPTPTVVRPNRFEDLDKDFQMRDAASQSRYASQERQEDVSYNTFAASISTDVKEDEESLQIVSIGDDEKIEHQLNLSEESILNGIILSEILGPPKSLRR